MVQYQGRGAEQTDDHRSRERGYHGNKLRHWTDCSQTTIHRHQRQQIATHLHRQVDYEIIDLQHRIHVTSP